MKIDRERVIRMSSAGYSLREIARELGCSHEGVRSVLAAGPLNKLPPVSISARSDGTVTLTTSGDPAVLGAAVRRALRLAGVEVEG